jgi:Trm5-related predicted tRNA methylase
MPAPPKPTPRLAPIAQAQAANEAADQELRRAVTVLVQAGLVSEESINEHRRWIDLTDAELRAVMWKQRREASGNG